MAPTATHEICGRPHNQLQRSEPRGRDSDRRDSELNDGLAGKLVGLPRVRGRGRNRGQVGDIGLERRAKAALASPMKASSIKVVSHARILGIDACGVGTARRRKTPYGRLVNIHKRYGAITSKLAKVGLMPSGPARYAVHGHAANKSKSLQDNGWAVPASQARRAIAGGSRCHECDPSHACRVEPIVAWAEAVWDQQLDDVELHKA